MILSGHAGGLYVYGVHEHPHAPDFFCLVKSPWPRELTMLARPGTRSLEVNAQKSPPLRYRMSWLHDIIKSLGDSQADKYRPVLYSHTVHTKISELQPRAVPSYNRISGR